ncbi:MAG: transporter substrate-binding domain-containing protein [Pseudomonadota bacterium]
MKFAYLIEPPFNFRNDHGKVVGCDVELARFVFSEIGEDFEPIETEFAELLPGVASGKWKMTTGMFATEERRLVASFSKPIWALPDGILVRNGNPLGLTGYRSIAEISDCNLAVIRDQFQHRSALEFGIPENRIRVFETYKEAASAVESGNADCYASVGRAHTGFLEQNRDFDGETIIVPAEEKEPAFGCFAFNRTDDALRTSVDEVLDNYLGGSEHRTMMKRYGFEDREIDLLVQTDS